MRVYGLQLETTSPTMLRGEATYTRVSRHTARPSLETFLPPEPQSAALSEPTPRAMYRVQSGDNLTRIVRDFLQRDGGTPTHRDIYDGVRKVVEANGIRNADLILPGQDIDLSVLVERHAAVPSPITALPNPIQVPTPPSGFSDGLQSTPSDVLLEQGLTKSTAPMHVATSAPEPDSHHLAIRPLEAPPSSVASPVGGTMHRVTVLQRLLNGTSDALSLVRELVEPGKREQSLVVETMPWEGVLNGEARLSSEFGMRKDPFTGRLAFHDGIDLAADRGTEIKALRGGEVVFSGWKGGYGNTVIVRHDDGLESVYGHISDNLVSVGDRVEGGATIATVGTTGRSTGPHLHLEIRRNGKAIDPVKYLN